VPRRSCVPGKSKRPASLVLFFRQSPLAGVAALPLSRRRAHLEAWLEMDLRLRFAGWILPIDESIAERWGVIAGGSQAYAMDFPAAQFINPGQH
jgi:hypothetical protein